MMTLAKLKDFNEFRVPFFKAWGVVALLGDAAICGSRESPYLQCPTCPDVQFCTISSRPRTVYCTGRRRYITSSKPSCSRPCEWPTIDQEIVVATRLTVPYRLPPVIGTFILVIGLEKRTATIGEQPPPFVCNPGLRLTVLCRRLQTSGQIPPSSILLPLAPPFPRRPNQHPSTPRRDGRRRRVGQQGQYPAQFDQLAQP